jgi:hypothetical protein
MTSAIYGIKLRPAWPAFRQPRRSNCIRRQCAYTTNTTASSWFFVNAHFEVLRRHIVGLSDHRLDLVLEFVGTGRGCPCLQPLSACAGAQRRSKAAITKAQYKSKSPQNKIRAATVSSSSLWSRHPAQTLTLSTRSIHNLR